MKFRIIIFIFIILLFTNTVFASDFYLKTTTAAEPKPGVTQQVDDTPDFGTYAAVLDATFTAPTASKATVRSQVYGSGQDDVHHYSESISWITFPLAAGSTGTGTFSTKVNAYMNVLNPNGAWLKAAFFRWKANDTVGEQIGSTITIPSALTTTSTSYTLTFTASGSNTESDGDKFYVECWFDFWDSASDSAVYTLSVSYNTVAIDAKITVPGTQAELVSGHNLLLLGVGQ